LALYKKFIASGRTRFSFGNILLPHYKPGFNPAAAIPGGGLNPSSPAK